ncbi:MAG: L-threonylcarbamoyladenylate synthase [Bacteroidota bacterium]|jgi:tRNA threonylcarbamoyl adenosine modification protein (Sua5/YciO/YrdC/YwlC family)
MYLRINPEKIDYKSLDKSVSILQKGGLIIYPTDTVYAIGCLISNLQGAERLAKIKNVKLLKANFTVVCKDFSHLSNYTKPISNSLFRILKHALPGPYTFILPAGNNLPKVFRENKKSIGLRVPNNPIVSYLVEKCGEPLISSSLHDEHDEIMEYFTEPELIYESFKSKVDLMIDGGFGNIFPSTIVDCTGNEPVVLRKGLGDVSFLNSF